MAEKGKLKQKTGANTSAILHPETDASITLYSKTIGSTSVTNVADALDAITAEMAANTALQTHINDTSNPHSVTASQVGLGNVANVRQVDAITVPSNIASISNQIVLWDGNDGHTVKYSSKTITTSAPSQGSNDTTVPTSAAVWLAIKNIPAPMQFKGTLGTGGTITDLPYASSNNKGFVYKVTEDGTYKSIEAKEGDTFVSDGDSWILIPSGDDVEDTWRSIKVNGTELLGNGISTGAVNFVNGGNITFTGSSGSITAGVASGYSIPSTANQTAWSAKYDKPSGGIPATDLASAVQTSLGKADTALQANQSITTTIKSGKKKDGTTDISANGSGATSITVTLGNSGVTAGTYSAVQVNAQGIVVDGAQVFKVIDNGGSVTDIATNGLYFEKDATT